MNKTERERDLERGRQIMRARVICSTLKTRRNHDVIIRALLYESKINFNN